MGTDMLIAQLGVSVVEGDLPDGWWGAYDADTHTITMLPKLAYIQWNSTLYHELGHAYYRHEGNCAKQERQASVWAARRLIKARDFIDANRLYHSVQEVAHYLSVMPEDVDTYISTLSPAEIVLIQQLIGKEYAC
jgi:hypothetical protein